MIARGWLSVHGELVEGILNYNHWEVEFQTTQTSHFQFIFCVSGKKNAKKLCFRRRLKDDALILFQSAESNGCIGTQTPMPVEQGQEKPLRPYQEESTTSRLISEVKPLRAWLVLGLETTWEHQVSLSFSCLSFILGLSSWQQVAQWLTVSHLSKTLLIAEEWLCGHVHCVIYKTGLVHSRSECWLRLVPMPLPSFTNASRAQIMPSKSLVLSNGSDGDILMMPSLKD